MATISVKHVPDLDAYVVDMPGLGGCGVRVILTAPEADRLAAGLRVAMARGTTPASSTPAKPKAQRSAK